MAVLYRLYQNKHKNSEFSGKWYARSIMTNTIDTDGIAERIQRNCTVKRSDVVAVISELVEVMKDELQNSHSVKLDGFGIFRIGLSTGPANTAADFTVQNNIRGARVNFLPQMKGGSTKGSKKTIQFLTGMKVKEAPKNDVDTTPVKVISNG